MTTSGLESSETVGAGSTEFVNVGSHAGPEETLADPVDSLGATKVAGGGAGMVSIENGFAEAGGNDDQGNRVGSR